MIGLELVVACQLIYFSLALYPQPSFISEAIKSFGLVSGYRAMFYRKKYGEILPPLTSTAQLSRQYLENNLIWTGLLITIFFLFLFVGLLSPRKNAQGTTKIIKKKIIESGENTLGRLYNALIFPVFGFGFMVVLISFFINQKRITLTK
jgi:hypothetical protein